MKNTRRTMSRITASLLCCLMLPAMPVLAEEEAAKDFLYYHTLSDYDVYLEYCELYGFEAEETLPEETALPDYQFFRHYIGVHGVVFYVYCDKEVPYEIDTQPEMFGLPADWYEHELLESGEDYELYSYHPVVQLFESAGIATTEQGTECNLYGIEYTFPNVKNYVPDYVEGSYEDSIVDIYRVRLSLHHSDFVAQYACLEDDINVSPVVQFYTINGGDTRPEVFGDINGDYVVDTKDSACILQYAAAVGAGYNGSLEEYMAE
ncbi:MAG: hypothetical protein IJY06_11180 [Oscillospiraceae bacterium]|nr:hypothetical protein [Oscillospiraceae bacterium]